ncbi:MAG: nuclear transport factor 2 family protein [Bacteroidota bacterium]
MKRLFLATVMVALCSFSLAQVMPKDDPNLSDAEKAVMKPIEDLFNGMRAGDSSMVHSAFYTKVTMHTSFTGRDGKPALREGSLDRFLIAVGTPHDVVWDEPIWDYEVRIDGNLAQVWTKYAFYAGENFSHCGVDAFHLTRTDGGWKIFHLTDTRQKEGCDIPEEVKKNR